MESKPRFNVDAPVQLRSTKELGLVKGVSLDGGEYWYKVAFDRRTDTVVEEYLEPRPAAAANLEDLAAQRQWGSIQAFRIALVLERIGNEYQSTVYAFRAQRILFEPYQYKPLLKMLESADRRLLIADEVGLGKTIETGLILAELEARHSMSMDRVLVVCPSRLREKWRDELSRKFGHDFDIMGRKELEEYIEKTRRNPGRRRLRAITSMQTIRNEDVRAQFLAEAGFIDLLIVDEAHHARNPSAKTSEMVRELCEAAGAVLMLTATPLHLGNRDLFTLVQALRPSEFRDCEVFDSRLREFKGIHEAGLLVRAPTKENLDRCRAILRRLFVDDTPPEARDPLAVQVIEDLDAAVPSGERRFWVDVERRIQDLHPLASILTRTRKRDVVENAPVRVAKVLRCQWTQEEDDAYRKLVPGASKLGWIDQRLSIGQLQRARQAASCLPAALQSTWAAAHADDDAVELTDIPPGELAGLAPDKPLPAPPRHLTCDSKLAKLLELLQTIQEAEPGAKVLVFTFFVGTSRYLQECLTEHGHPCLRIAGDVPSDPRNPQRDERGAVMKRFRDEPGVRVLVSTEVGSEGLDFQYCHCLINYDLPWNPMVVEQRIGRIDRFGQKSARLNIFSLVVEGTVEDRILYRLYDRIGIFSQSIGQLEAILGEEIDKLQKSYVGGTLTPAEADRQFEQSAHAIEARRAHIELLEKNAGNLFGHEEYLKEQLARVNRLGRFISEKAMLAVIDAYLHARHPTIRYWEEPAGIYRLQLTDALRLEIQSASQPDIWLDRSRKGVLAFCFDGERAYYHAEVELINVGHPLLKAAKAAVSGQLHHAQARVAKGTLVLPDQNDSSYPGGNYFLLVFTHAVEGIRSRRILETIAWSVATQAVLPVEDGERLLHLVQDNGTEWDAHVPDLPLPVETFAKMESEARARNRALREAEKRENSALYLRRKALLEAEFRLVIADRQTKLNTARSRGSERILPALQGQIQKAEVMHRARLAELEKLREASCTLSAPVAVCLIRVVRSLSPTESGIAHEP